MKEKKTQGIMIYQDIPKVFTEEEIKCSTKQAFIEGEREKEKNWGSEEMGKSVQIFESGKHPEKSPRDACCRNARSK